MADSDAEKTEDASERRIEQYRREGRVATSRELVAAVSLAVGAFFALVAIAWAAESMVNLLRATMLQSASSGEFTTGDVPRLFFECLAAMAPAVLVVVVPAWLATLATGMAATRFNVTTEVLDLKWERLDPFGAFQQIYLSRTPWVQLAKGLAITSVIVWAVWGALEANMDALPLLASWTVGGQIAFLEDLTVDVLKRAIPAALAIGAVDYLYQRWDMAQQMMMTKQEVKQEHKESDGDPMIKARRRARARQIVFSNQLRDVVKADVVVTNPTHYAVALRYRKEENAAPVVLARGVDHLAALIRAAATRNDVPILENRQLARALYAQARAGRPIPKDLFAPVAQVLAAVYRRRKAGAAASAAQGRPVTPVVRPAPAGAGGRTAAGSG